MGNLELKGKELSKFGTTDSKMKEQKYLNEETHGIYLR